MSRLRLVFEVATWEFLRLFKPRDLLISLLLAVLVALAYVGGRALFERSLGGKARLAVLHGERLPFQLSAEGDIELVTATRGESALREAVGRKQLDGLLIVHSIDEAELWVAKRPYWQDELRLALSAARSKARLEAAALSPPKLAAITAPFQLHLHYHESGTPFDYPKIVTVGVMLGLMLMGVILGSTYLFVGISGEKQLRVTEAIVSAIPPQVWIDGKILGHSAMTLVSVLNLGVSVLCSNLVLNFFGRGIQVPSFSGQPLLLLALLMFSVLGFYFWFTFFAAIAATVEDPNTSSRGMILFLPFMPLSLGFLALVREADNWPMKVLGIFPLTCPSVMPVRIAVTSVAAWELLLAVVLQLGSIWLMRRAAGKIFALGILMYGKEPRWREMWRWLKEA